MKRHFIFALYANSNTNVVSAVYRKGKWENQAKEGKELMINMMRLYGKEEDEENWYFPREFKFPYLVYLWETENQTITAEAERNIIFPTLPHLTHKVAFLAH